ncbi:MAG: hypothetical protein QM728_11920 [Gordonia sp. (in: high G+C Gram-positive bacteria)]|uniref:hypothetical protein n=1 Tax=Gordonia sp. (in: high G+C Gram-positive bacteria) TaxID=84139 RepID=UPI0039E4DCE2
MLRFAIILALASGVFSFLSFKRGGVIPGLVFALVAIALIAWLVMSARAGRSGQPLQLSSTAQTAVRAGAALLAVGLVYSLYWTFFAAKASTEDLKYSADLSKVCGRAPTYFRDAAPYTGDGPHPTAVFARSGTDASGLRQVRITGNTPPGYDTQNAKAVQLVACFNDVSSGDKVDDCEFNKGTMPVYQGRYKGKLVEARTGKKVADISVDGSREKNCPFITMVRGKAEDNRLHTEPDSASIQSVLNPYVNK